MQIFSKKDLSIIPDLLKAGKTVVFPTETSYGLGCDATNQKAVAKIFQIKDRPQTKSLLIIVPTIEMAKKYLEWNELLEKLSKKYWPGPLTIIGKSIANLPRGVVAKDGTIAIRVTKHPVAKYLSEELGSPIVATSANISEQGDIYNPADLIESFKEKSPQPDIILNYGKLPKRKPTTIANIADGSIKILRQGALRIRVQKKQSKSFLFLFITFAAAVASALVIYSQGVYASSEISSQSIISQSIKISIPAGILYQGRKHMPIKVKGIYLTAYSAGNPAKVQEIVDLIDSTELNSIVIDLKDYSGNILYNSDLPFVKQIGAKDVRIKDLPGLIQNLKKHNIYTIARISVFQDPLLAEKKPEWALKTKTGELWRDKKGLAWVDPSKENVWNYVISVAKEAANLGFDEINFDYIRFPTDGTISDIAYQKDLKKYKVIGDFFKYAGERMSNVPVYLSADLFGLTTELGGENDMKIGQRLADAAQYFDYVMPMVYPSHYPAGYMNFANPADHPYDVVFQAMSKGQEQAKDKKAKLRPWLQAFDLGAVYDGEKIRAEIKAADDTGADGWVLWNASNRYTADGLIKD